MSESKKPRFAIFDLDNTLYHEPLELSVACEEAMARAAESMVEGLTYEAALYVSQTSNHQTGSVRTYFAERYDLDPAELHQLYHDMVDHLILPVCEDTRAAFAKIDTDVLTLGLLTHGSRRWTDRVLEHLGLGAYFPADLRIAVEDVEFHHKHESERPFLEIVARAGKQAGHDINAADCLVVEDRAPNLQIAHKMGMQTVLVTHGEGFTPADYIDHSAENVVAVIDNFLA